MAKFKDLTNQKFGRLKVIKRSENRISSNGRPVTQWYCQCDCGNFKVVDSRHLTDKSINSCGCLGYETKISNGKRNKQYNIYDLSGNCAIGYTFKGEEFFFDLDDYEKIKDYCWYKSDDGYIVNKTYDNQILLMHRLILNCEIGDISDHDNRIRHDNRKQNLRKCSTYENARNISIPINNSSGIIGVSWSERENKWWSRICIEYNQINLGYFLSKYDAILSRLKAEKEYFGDFAPQRHLFKEFNL